MFRAFTSMIPNWCICSTKSGSNPRSLQSSIRRGDRVLSANSPEKSSNVALVKCDSCWEELVAKGKSHKQVISVG